MTTNYTRANGTSWRINNTEKVAIYSVLFLIATIGNTTSFIALRFEIYLKFLKGNLVKLQHSILLNRRMNKKECFENSKSRIRLLLMNLCIADLMVNQSRTF
jgi:hypothetical protein